jgi:hypothetical protein
MAAGRRLQEAIRALMRVAAPSGGLGTEPTIAVTAQSGHDFYLDVGRRC